MKHPAKIRKRDGRIVDFNEKKITDAIFKAAQAIGGSDYALAQKLSRKVVEILNEKYGEDGIPSVEEVQDIVEKVLIEAGHAKTAKAYILYRKKRTELREAKQFYIGVPDELKLSLNALKVLERRYLLKNEKGEVVETPLQLFKRVAKNIAQADLKYDKNADVKKTEQEFYSMMVNFEFLPNSPTLMNAGTELGQLAACFVIPVEDSLSAIFEAVKYAALIHKTGGGTGFSFSRLRPKNDVVKTTGGIASGPVSFMRVFDVATEVIKQGGRRRGANMGVLRVDHPDILDFITAKEKEGMLSNFNISVGATDEFMQAVEKDENYALVNPRTKEVVQRIRAKDVFNLIVTMAWKNGDPGMIFIDRINRDNPTPKLGEIEATNPCGEQPLLPYEACNLGSINLSKFVKEGRIDFPRLKDIVWKAVHFLDNVIDQSKYPLKKIEEMVQSNRKIGLGVMGFADMLLKLGIPYDSEHALETAEKVMRFIKEEATKASIELAKKRGPFPNFSKSVYAEREEPERRNATLITIAPTGSISIIANTSSGIEPLFAVVFVRNVMEGTELLEINPVFEEIARKRGFYSERLMREIAKTGSVQKVRGVPGDIKRLFVTAHEIAPKWHVLMQAAFQKHVDNAVSKTVNLPYHATPMDVADVFWLAYKTGCKGITVYRDRSKPTQVLYRGEVSKESSIYNELTQRLSEKYFAVDSEYVGGCPTCSP